MLSRRAVIALALSSFGASQVFAQAAPTIQVAVAEALDCPIPAGGDQQVCAARCALSHPQAARAFLSLFYANAALIAKQKSVASFTDIRDVAEERTLRFEQLEAAARAAEARVEEQEATLVVLKRRKALARFVGHCDPAGVVMPIAMSDPIPAFDLEELIERTVCRCVGRCRGLRCRGRRRCARDTAAVERCWELFQSLDQQVAELRAAHQMADEAVAMAIDGIEPGVETRELSGAMRVCKLRDELAVRMWRTQHERDQAAFDLERAVGRSSFVGSASWGTPARTNSSTVQRSDKQDVPSLLSRR